MERADFITSRTELLYHVIVWRKELKRVLAYLVGFDLEALNNAPDLIKHVADTLSQDYTELKIISGDLVVKSNAFCKIIQDELKETNSLKLFAEAILADKDTGFVSLFFPNIKLRQDADKFHTDLSRAITQFKKLVSASPTTIDLQLDFKNGLEDIILQLSRIIPAERRNNERSAKTTPAEVRAARWTAIPLFTATIISIIWAVCEYRDSNANKIEASKDELVSEYKIRLGETQYLTHFLSESNFTATNMESNVARQSLLNIIKGGYGVSKDERTYYSWERIIRDLQTEYNQRSDADAAANAVLGLELVMEGTQPYSAASISNNVSELNTFAITNHF